VAAERSLASEAYATLKARIIRCEIAPGERLTEARLVRELGLGKTPIREALVRLIHERLVRNMPQHGYEVTPITLADVEDLFRLRLILEPAAMELAAGRIDASLRDRLQALCRVTSYSPGDPRSVDAYRRANHEFHILVARASGSRRLADAIERLEEESDRVFNLGLTFRDRGDAVRLGHQRILAALVAGDAEAARRHAVEGIHKAERAIKEALLTSPSIRTATLTGPPGRARVASAALNR
jgi:DNA-binding GntR family transcriptional regulator